MSAPDLVTCVIPVFNGEKYLAEAIDSVLSQTHSVIEIVVVDDGSTDSTPEILKNFGAAVRSVRQENAGPAAARNRGIEQAKGEYIAFLDADDLWLAEKTAVQLLRFEDLPGPSTCTCLMQNFWAEELKEEAARMKDTDTARPQPGPSQTMIARREAFDLVGLFDASMTHRDTQDWIVRAREAGVRFDHIDEVLVHRRIHESNMSRSRGAVDAEDLFAIVQKRLTAKSAAAKD